MVFEKWNSAEVRRKRQEDRSIGLQEASYKCQKQRKKQTSLHVPLETLYIYAYFKNTNIYILRHIDTLL